MLKIVRVSILSGMFLFMSGAIAQDQASQRKESLPAAKAAESVFRILFLPPKSELKSFELKKYEEEIEGSFPETSFMGWWFRQVGSQCREENKDQCPLMADLIPVQQGFLPPIGSAFLAGDQKTVYTAAHVWVRFDLEMKSLGDSSLSEMEKQEKAKDQIGRAVDFILFDGQGKIIFNTYDDDDKATIQAYAVPGLFHLLYPENVPPGINENFEFLIFELNQNLTQPALEFAEIESSDTSNGISLEYGTPLLSLGFPANTTIVDSPAIVRTVLSRDYIDSIEGSPFMEQDEIRILETITFSMEHAAFPGMSGGPILNEMGEVVSLNSGGLVMLPGPVNMLDNLKFRWVLAGVPPRWLPGIGIDRKD